MTGTETIATESFGNPGLPNGIELHLGDCREIMPTLPEASCTGIVTDPPYELGFMGKQWDRQGVAFDVDVWREALRVCKPGALLFAFGGSRTWHRLACAIEDAGWIVRDCISSLFDLAPVVNELAESLDLRRRELLAVILEQLTGQRALLWMYGEGMPKGQAIGKAIDKAAGVERKILGKRVYAGGHIQRSRAPSHYGDAPASRDLREVTAPATPAAELWEGWNTALAPAWEPIVWAMKPLEGTFAQNALEHGVAGLNVDGSRIPVKPGDYDHAGSPATDGADNAIYGLAPNASKKSPPHDQGRWPTNVLLDSEAAARLDATTGERITGGADWPRIAIESRGIYGASRRSGRQLPHQFGGPSRFFSSADRFIYNSKATAEDRGHRKEKALPLFDQETEDREIRCKHPTVKPLAVCEWLVKLAKTPEHTRILDPFAGTATTGRACLRLGCEYVGIEIDSETYTWAEDMLRRERKRW
jgi:site-specific DNA-methyltransferase (adenine-specific)